MNTHVHDWNYASHCVMLSLLVSRFDIVLSLLTASAAAWSHRVTDGASVNRSSHMI